MVNKKLERLIKFPVSNWIADVNKLAGKIPSCAYCICYQFGLNEDNYGPYGFSTSSSEGLLRILFPEPFFYDKDNLELKQTSNFGKSGIYFYGETAKEINSELKEYKKASLKKRLLVNKGQGADFSIKAPAIVGLYEDNKVCEAVLTSFIQRKYSFFFSCFLTPMAGQTFIFFESDIWEKARSYCEVNGVQIFEANSVDELSSW